MQRWFDRGNRSLILLRGEWKSLVEGACAVAGPSLYIYKHGGSLFRVIGAYENRSKGDKSRQTDRQSYSGKRGEGGEESEELKKTHDDGCYVGQGHCG